MKPDQTKEETLFNAARALTDLKQRTAFLDAACHGDGELRQKMEALFAAQAKANAFFDRGPQDPGLSPPSTDSASSVFSGSPGSETAGDHIGRYKLLEKIGEGGCGVVYMAEQQEPVKRRVALKVIKLGMDTRRVIARFEAERQALALMDHPNIAKVLDAGATETGRPYFVMELVRGLKITEYCDENHLSTRERLELFIRICHSVQHAHQKGIIHRDLKPSNILVTMNDGVPVPKVIDFGIAKATAGQELTDKTLFTAYEQFVGTPAYMSPEQAALTSLDIDTRTDIYSLGVLLYELLTGKTPFDATELLKSGLDAMRRTICEKEPLRPSTRLTQDLVAADVRRLTSKLEIRNPPVLRSSAPHEPICGTTAEGGKSEIDPASRRLLQERKELINVLRGDVDWIVMKCLEKDRTRRYETANGLALEVKRYLNDEPVLASPPSATYRLGKFAKAHRAMLTTIAIVVSVLIVSTVVSTWLAVRATQAEKLAANRLGRETQARQEADEARKQAVSDREQARHRLYDARLAQAKASRWSRQLGQRFESLRALAEAVQVARELHLGKDEMMELRNEAIACMALADLQLVKEWEGYPPGSSSGFAFDAKLQRYARSDSRGNISIRRADDDQELVRLPGEGTGAARMGFSPSGDRLAEQNWHPLPGRISTNFRLWDWEHGTNVLQPSSPLAVRAFDFSPDGSRLALGLTDNTLLLLDPVGGTELRRLKPGLTPFSLAFAPDGTRLAMYSEQSPVVQVRNIATGDVLWSSPALNALAGIAWHPDGVLLATGCGLDVHLWNVSGGRPHAVFKGHQNVGIRVLFSPQANLLMSSAWDDTTRIWNPWTGRQLLSFSATICSFNRDGTRFASRTGTRLSLWEVASGKEYRTLPSRFAGSIHGVSVSPDGRWLGAATSEGIRLWDLTRDKECVLLPARDTSAALFHPAGRELITTGSTGIYSWPLQMEAESLRIGPPRRILPAGPFGRAALDQTGGILVVGARHGGLIKNLEQPSASGSAFEHINARDVAVSSDGRWAASGTDNGNGIKVWEVSSGGLARLLLPDARKSLAVFSPDGRWLVTSTDTDGFCFFRVPSWQLVRRVACRSGQNPGSLAFTSDGKMVALELSPGVVQLSAPETGQPIATLQSPDSDNYSGFCFSPDGSQLAMILGPAQGVQVWDLRQVRKQLQELGLDWDLPPYAPGPSSGELKPVRVEVHLGRE